MVINEWFIGVVEDVADPLESGRVKVRAFDYHNDNRQLIPTEALLWMQTMLPVDAGPQQFGVGKTPHQLQPNTWVLGFWRDPDHQDGVILAIASGGLTNPGTRATYEEGSTGFGDPANAFADNPWKTDTPKDSSTTSSTIGDSFLSQLFAGNLIHTIIQRLTVPWSSFEVEDVAPKEFSIVGAAEELLNIAKSIGLSSGGSGFEVPSDWGNNETDKVSGALKDFIRDFLGGD